jgi:hypothetical protein
LLRRHPWRLAARGERISSPCGQGCVTLSAAYERVLISPMTPWPKNWSAAKLRRCVGGRMRSRQELASALAQDDDGRSDRPFLVSWSTRTHQPTGAHWRPSSGLRGFVGRASVPRMAIFACPLVDCPFGDAMPVGNPIASCLRSGLPTVASIARALLWLARAGKRNLLPDGCG